MLPNKENFQTQVYVNQFWYWSLHQADKISIGPTGMLEQEPQTDLSWKTYSSTMLTPHEGQVWVNPVNMLLYAQKSVTYTSDVLHSEDHTD